MAKFTWSFAGILCKGGVARGTGLQQFGSSSCLVLARYRRARFWHSPGIFKVDGDQLTPQSNWHRFDCFLLRLDSELLPGGKCSTDLLPSSRCHLGRMPQILGHLSPDVTSFQLFPHSQRRGVFLLIASGEERIWKASKEEKEREARDVSPANSCSSWVLC